MSMYAPDRSRWLWLAAGLGILVTWCASLWMVQAPLPERPGRSRSPGPPKLPTRHAERPSKASQASSRDPGQAYETFVARWKKGVRLQELQWILHDFEKDHSLSSLELTPRNEARRRRYLEALKDGLSWSPSQLRQAEERLPEWPENESLAEELQPWRLADLLESQKRLTWEGVSFPEEEEPGEASREDSSLSEFPRDFRRVDGEEATREPARAALPEVFRGCTGIFPEPDEEPAAEPGVLPLHPAQLQALLSLHPERAAAWAAFLEASDRLPEGKASD